MDCRMNEIVDGLFVGSLFDARDTNQLEKHKITHIVTILGRSNYFLPDKYYLCVQAEDASDQNLKQYISVCNDFIHAARLNGSNVLVHCLAGVSRSVTIVSAYLMSITHLTADQAVQMVRSKRFVANPNVGFRLQLQQFEAEDLPKEKERLIKQFPESHLKESDENKCKQFIYLYTSGSSASFLYKDKNEGVVIKHDTEGKPQGGMFGFSLLFAKSEKKPHINNSAVVTRTRTIADGVEVMPNVILYSPVSLKERSE